MKIALCLHGLVGSIKGKNYELLGGSDIVLQKAYEHNKQFIMCNDVDIFVHSWSTECADVIVKLYSPKKHIIEPQKQFKSPKYIHATHDRAFAHVSRWFSFKRVVELKSLYEHEHNFIYDLVLVQRFDLCWNVPVEFNAMDTDKITVGKSQLNTNHEWQDQWFVANSNNINRFATLYDMIPIYMDTNGSLISSKQYGGISSHFLARHHAIQLNLRPDFKYNFGIEGRLPNDYTEVRRQYYGE